MKRYIAFVFTYRFDVEHGWNNVLRNKRTEEVASWDVRWRANAAAKKELRERQKRGEGRQESQVVDLHTGEMHQVG